MEAEAGFQQAGKVSCDCSSQAGIEFISCLDPGLPIRPHCIDLSPTDSVTVPGPTEALVSTIARSSSSVLAEVLRREPLDEPQFDEQEEREERGQASEARELHAREGEEERGQGQEQEGHPQGPRSERQGVPLDLVVFSACRTALGDANAELGFSGLALQAGARSAVGTLWYVDDVVTSAYFVQMYRYLDQGVPKAEALQLTRQAVLRNLVRLDGDRVMGVNDQPLLLNLTPSQQRRINSGANNPFFWAGIELMGSPW